MRSFSVGGFRTSECVNLLFYTLYCCRNVEFKSSVVTRQTVHMSVCLSYLKFHDKFWIDFNTVWIRDALFSLFPQYYFTAVCVCVFPDKFQS